MFQSARSIARAARATPLARPAPVPAARCHRLPTFFAARNYSAAPAPEAAGAKDEPAAEGNKEADDLAKQLEEQKKLVAEFK
ncbi:hypothetical protein JCM10213_002134, partial [Rhodosporidiobolus nylandii]